MKKKLELMEEEEEELREEKLIRLRRGEGEIRIAFSESSLSAY